MRPGCRLDLLEQFAASPDRARLDAIGELAKLVVAGSLRV